jgi:hypothetical protein
VLSQTADFAKTFVGSPHYLAPEVVDQQPYNGKADMWSLGCVLYEVMSGGRRVFDGSSLVAVLSDIVSGSFPTVDEVVDCLGPGERLQGTAKRTAFGPELRKIVGKLLQAEPEKRASVTMLLRVPFITARSGTLLPPELQKTAQYAEQLRSRTSRPRLRGGHETPLAFGGGDTWSEAASAAASPIMRPLRRIRSDTSMAHSPTPGNLPRGHSGAELPRAHNNNPNLRLKMALDAKRNHASQDGSPQSEGLQHLHRQDSRNGTVLFPRDSPMIPIFGSEFASGNASPAAGSFRQPKRGAPNANAHFERSDDSEHPLLRDIADLVPMEEGGDPAVAAAAAAAAVAAAVGDAEKALRVSEEMGISDSDDDDDDDEGEEEYSDDFDSAMDSSVGDEVEQRVYTTWACPRIDVGFQLRERLSTARKARETARAAAETGRGSANDAFSNTAPPQVVSDLEMLLDSKSPDATRR